MGIYIPTSDEWQELNERIEAIEEKLFNYEEEETETTEEEEDII